MPGAGRVGQEGRQQAGRQSWRPAAIPAAAANRNVSGPLRLRQRWPIQEVEMPKRQKNREPAVSPLASIPTSESVIQLQLI